MYDKERTSRKGINTNNASTHNCTLDFIYTYSTVRLNEKPKQKHFSMFNIKYLSKFFVKIQSVFGNNPIHILSH